jgi:hypothetical protein
VESKDALLFLRNDGCCGDEAVVFCLTWCVSRRGTLRSLRAVADAEENKSDDVVMLADSTEEVSVFPRQNDGSDSSHSAEC